MNEIGQYITGSFAGAASLGYVIYRITQKYKTAKGLSGNAVKVLPAVLSLILGTIIAFLYPPMSNTANDAMPYMKYLSIGLYGTVNSMLIFLAALGSHNLFRRVSA